MKIKNKVIGFGLSICILLSATGFNSKESNVDQNLLKNDFYTAVNKDWLSSVTLKEGQLVTSLMQDPQDKVNEYTTKVFKDLLENKSKFESSSAENVIVNFYEGFLDSEGRNKDGLKDIKPYLDKIRSVKNINELTDLLKDPEFSLYNGLYDVSYMQDYKNKDKNTLYITPPYQTLAYPETYTSESDEVKAAINNIKEYYSSLLYLSGNSKEEAKAKADNFFEFEKVIANDNKSLLQLLHTTDINLMQKQISLNEFDSLTSNIKLNNIIKSLGYDKTDTVSLQVPQYFKKINEIYTNENLDLFKDFLEIKLLLKSINFLPEDFYNIKNKFDGTKLTNEQVASTSINELFKDVIANYFIKDNFTVKEKANIDILIKKVINGYKETLLSTNTLSDETKKNALKKLDKMKVDMTYYKNHSDYSGLKFISPENGGSLLQNYTNYLKFKKQENINNFNKEPIDPAWSIVSPLDSNAAYSRISNTMLFPVGLLLPPYYDSSRSQEENLATIGFIIGHEISHGFDFVGSTFDENGKLNNWWTDKDRQNFTEIAGKVKDFYSKVEHLPGIFVNGELTLDENMADISSMTCMLKILEGMENPNYKKFFESYAKAWRMFTTEENAIFYLYVDTHAPQKERVNVVLKQFDKFYETYGIKKGDKMYVEPNDRLKIW